MKKAVIFDLDGTLWDSSKAMYKSWEDEIERIDEGFTLLPFDEYTQLLGKTVDDITRAVFPTLDLETATPYMNRLFEAENDYIREHGGNLYAGLEETLEQLKKDYSLYIVSNCQTGYIEAFYDYHKVGHFFEDYESNGGTRLPKWENIKLIIERNDVDKAVYVGDTEGDYQSAIKAGVPFIYATYGFGKITGEEVEVDSFPEVIDAVKKFL